MKKLIVVAIIAIAGIMLTGTVAKAGGRRSACSGFGPISNCFQGNSTRNYVPQQHRKPKKRDVVARIILRAISHPQPRYYRRTSRQDYTSYREHYYVYRDHGHRHRNDFRQRRGEGRRHGSDRSSFDSCVNGRHGRQNCGY